MPSKENDLEKEKKSNLIYVNQHLKPHLHKLQKLYLAKNGSQTMSTNSTSY